MLSDRSHILAPHDMLDQGAGRPPFLCVLRFSHFVQSDGLGVWTRVRKGRRPSKQYVKPVYRAVRVTP